MTKRFTLTGVSFALALFALPGVACAEQGFARGSGTLRAGPANNYPLISGVARGESLEIYGCLRGYTWCDVSNGEDRGWYPASRIGFVRDGRNLTVSSGAALLGLSILSFGVGDYWGSHYENRPFYNDRRWNRDRNRGRMQDQGVEGHPRDQSGSFQQNPRGRDGGQPMRQMQGQQPQGQTDQQLNGAGRPGRHNAQPAAQQPLRQAPQQGQQPPMQQRQAPAQQPGQPSVPGSPKCQASDNCQ